MTGGGAASGSWADALLPYVQTPASPAIAENVLWFDDDVTALADKYPKGRTHVLIVPREPSRFGRLPRCVREFSPVDQALCQCLASAVVKTIRLLRGTKRHSELGYSVGFHALPSMTHLHVHIVSRDFAGCGLKHKKHWNSMTTAFFIPLGYVLQSMVDTAASKKSTNTCESIGFDEWQTDACINTMTVPALEKLAEKTPLFCPFCEEKPKFESMPKLKAHLSTGTHLESVAAINQF